MINFMRQCRLDYQRFLEKREYKLAQRELFKIGCAAVGIATIAASVFGGAYSLRECSSLTGRCVADAAWTALGFGVRVGGIGMVTLGIGNTVISIGE